MCYFRSQAIIDLYDNVEAVPVRWYIKQKSIRYASNFWDVCMCVPIS